MDRKILETYPQYVIDGIELNEEQCREYDELLEACAGNESLCQETWKSYNFSDGQVWMSMDALRSFENEPNFRAHLEGEDLSDLD